MSSATARSLQKSTTVRAITKSLARTLVHGADAVSTPAAAWMARQMFSKPRKFSTPSRERALREAGIDVVLPTRHGELRGWRFGEGPRILLVHGWEGRGTQLGAFVRPLTRAGFEVLAYDNPGHGKSPGMFGPAPYFADAIEDIAADRELFGVVAHSMGALATSMAMRRGVRVERLAYVAPAAAPDRGVELMTQLLDLDDAVVAEFKRQLLALQPMSWEELREGALPRDRSAELLLVHDEEDTEVDPRISRTIHAAWPDSQLVMTTGLGHTRILRAPEVVERVADFLTGTTAAQREAMWPWQAFLRGADVPGFAA